MITWHPARSGAPHGCARARRPTCLVDEVRCYRGVYADRGSFPIVACTGVVSADCPSCWWGEFGLVRSGACRRNTQTPTYIRIRLTTHWIHAEWAPEAVFALGRATHAPFTHLVLHEDRSTSTAISLSLSLSLVGLNRQYVDFCRLSLAFVASSHPSPSPTPRRHVWSIQARCYRGVQSTSPPHAASIAVRDIDCCSCIAPSPRICIASIDDRGTPKLRCLDCIHLENDHRTSDQRIHIAGRQHRTVSTWIASQPQPHVRSTAQAC